MDMLVKLRVSLIPVARPWVRIQAPGFDHRQRLSGPAVFDIDFYSAESQQTLTIEHHDKSDLDATTAVMIDSVSFFGIQDPRFAWAGVYRPCYPEPWASQQADLADELSPHTYLGWNGVWRLTFGVPVFTWIHRVQNLGWIYG